eukprot:1459594-Rhodomonas_salina.1
MVVPGSVGGAEAVCYLLRACYPMPGTTLERRALILRAYYYSMSGAQRVLLFHVRCTALVQCTIAHATPSPGLSQRSAVPDAESVDYAQQRGVGLHAPRSSTIPRP